MQNWYRYTLRQLRNFIFQARNFICGSKTQACSAICLRSLSKIRVFNVQIMFLVSKIILFAYNCSRYHHEQDLDESFKTVVFSSNFDKTEWGSCMFKVQAWNDYFLSFLKGYNDNNNNNLNSGGRGPRENQFSYYAFWSAQGQEKRRPKHKCCGKKVDVRCSCFRGHWI